MILVAVIEDLRVQRHGLPLLRFNGQYGAAEPPFELDPNIRYF